jgi:hypothetical protein
MNRAIGRFQVLTVTSRSDRFARYVLTKCRHYRTDGCLVAMGRVSVRVIPRIPHRERLYVSTLSAPSAVFGFRPLDWLRRVTH